MSFEEFVDAIAGVGDGEADEHFRSQHTFVTNGSGGIGVDFLGRFETLGDDFRRVRERLGLPVPSLPHVQAVKTRRAYREYYTERTRDIVARRFRRGVELFGYAYAG